MKKTIDIFPNDYTLDTFFNNDYQPVEHINTMFRGCKAIYDNMARATQKAIKEVFTVYVNGNIETIKNELAKNKPSKKTLKKAIIDIKNAIETMPYTPSTKQTVYVYIKKDLLPLFNEILSDEQILILYKLNCLSPKEDSSRMQKKDARADYARLNPLTITDDFIENIYKPTSIDMLVSNNLAELVIGVMMITGRRPAEIVQSMQLDFEPYNKHGYVVFAGQKKKNVYLSGKGDKLEIPLLLNREFILLFQERFTFLKELIRYKYVKNVKLADIDARTFSNWTGYVRKIFKARLPQVTDVIGGKMYTLRSIYACYMLENDNNKNLSPTAYLCSILGHSQDDTVNLHYEKICYSRSGKPLETNKKLNKAKSDSHEKIAKSMVAFISKKYQSFAPEDILPCQHSEILSERITGYSFFLTIAVDEKKPILSIYYPNNVRELKLDGDIEVVVLIQSEKKIIDWKHGKAGLCRFIIKNFIPDFVFKKKAIEKKFNRMNADFQLNRKELDSNNQKTTEEKGKKTAVKKKRVKKTNDS